MKGRIHTYGQIHQIGDGKYQHIPGAPQNSVRTRLHTDEYKEVGDKGQVSRARPIGFPAHAVSQEGGYDRAVKQRHYHGYDDGETGHNAVAGPVSLLHPFHLSGADVLGREGGHGVARCNHGHHADGLNPASR